MMSIVFTWRKRSNIGLALILIGLTSLVQSFIVLNAQTSLGITSVYLLALVPIGVCLALSGVELSLAETVFRRSSYRERRPSRWKAPQRNSLRALYGRLEIAAAFSVLVVLAISFMSYFAIIALLEGTAIPMFARFVLAESVSMMVAVALGIIATRIL